MQHRQRRGAPWLPRSSWQKSGALSLNTPARTGPRAATPPRTCHYHHHTGRVAPCLGPSSPAGALGSPSRAAGPFTHRYQAGGAAAVPCSSSCPSASSGPPSPIRPRPAPGEAPGPGRSARGRPPPLRPRPHRRLRQAAAKARTCAGGAGPESVQHQRWRGEDKRTAQVLEPHYKVQSQGRREEVPEVPDALAPAAGMDGPGTWRWTPPWRRGSG